MEKTVIGLFDSRAEAESLLRDLERNGFTRDDISLLVSQENMEYSPEDRLEVGEATHLGNSLMAGLRWLLAEIGLVDPWKGTDLSSGERGLYAEGVRRGGTLIRVRANEAMAEQAMRIMRSHDVVSIDERSAQWRENGWTPPETDAGMGWRPAAAAPWPDGRDVERRTGVDRRRGGGRRAGESQSAG